MESSGKGQEINEKIRLLFGYDEYHINLKSSLLTEITLAILDVLLL